VRHCARLMAFDRIRSLLPRFRKQETHRADSLPRPGSTFFDLCQTSRPVPSVNQYHRTVNFG
jgi:hypothetical protein